jgi:hypothetical protein
MKANCSLQKHVRNQAESKLDVEKSFIHQKKGTINAICDEVSHLPPWALKAI